MWRCALIAVLALPAIVHGGVLHRYTVDVDATLERLSVAACFDGPAPSLLIAESEGASLYLQRVEVRAVPGTKVRALRNEMALPSLPANACLDYQVQLQPVQGGAQTGGPETRRIGADLLTSIGDWLWRPPVLDADEEIELRFVSPAGVSVSAPWQRDARGAYRIGRSPPEWPAVVAFGRFPLHAIEVPGAVLEVALLDGPTPEQRDQALRWIDKAARAVTTAYGRFPVSRLQVIVAATPRGRGPVPWAYVARGGGPGVHFFINPQRTEGEFVLDWSAVHEMSHLFLPHITARDVWLYEGLATYLQNVLMARAGLISQDEAWRRLYLGFQRASQVGRGLTMQQATERLNRPGTYLRVYWGGAAVLLEADLRLREKGSSLDAALASLGCCLDPAGRVPAQEVLARLDQATGLSVFAELQKRVTERQDFPDFDALFMRLGVDVFGGEVRYSSDAEARRLREGIMAPR
jgi:hypothetical protein